MHHLAHGDLIPSYANSSEDVATLGHSKGTSAVPGWWKLSEELLTHFFRRLITFSLKGLQARISAEWPFWFSGDFEHLMDLACLGAGIPAAVSWSELQRDLEGHLKMLLRQGDFVLGTALGKDRIKLFGGKHSLVPAWSELQTQSSALIQKGHHTSPALG